MRPIYIACLLLIVFQGTSYAKSKPAKPNFLGDCNPSTAQIDLNVNGVRARLLAGGDMWWDGGSIGKYVVPKTSLVKPEVSAIFAGALWFGSKDAVGNLKIAAQTYRTSGRDYWPGPVVDNQGVTDKQTCSNWDRHFQVLGTQIEYHLLVYKNTKENNVKYELAQVPENVKNWPAKGNPYFQQNLNFPLPKTSLAPFFDQDGDDNYDPIKGDYPVIDHQSYTYADQMIFWVTNDVGNVHTSTKGSEPVGLEIQNMAYAFVSGDYVVNNATFYSHRIINRKSTLLSDAYLGLWTDTELGCGSDDMVGCDTLRNLMYLYNGDETDGTTDCTCGSSPTYCNELPMLGIDILYCPPTVLRDINGIPYDTVPGKMNSFNYMFSSTLNPAAKVPQNSQEVYNCLSGLWSDGQKMTYGGTGYDLASNRFTNYAFTDEPCNGLGWSFANVSTSGRDFKTLQSAGPYSLLPGQFIDFVYGVVFAPKVVHPKPCLNAIRDVDDRIQRLFDDHFRIISEPTEGPDAPGLIANSLTNAVGFTFQNGANSNNYLQKFEVPDRDAPLEAIDKTYNFEGYRVFQLNDTNAIKGLDYLYKNPNAIEVFQCDLSNSIQSVYEHVLNAGSAWLPVSWTKVAYLNGAQNAGIPQSFAVTTDAFTGKPLENGKTYYYTVVAYAYNNHTEFNTVENYGQRKQYLQGKRNVKVYAVSPKKSVGAPLEATVVRLEGQGTGTNILQIAPNMRDSIFRGNNQGRVTYAASSSPVQIVVVDPSKCKNKQFQLTLIDTNLSDTLIDVAAKWKLTEIATPTNIVVISEKTISEFNNQLLDQYGFFLKMDQVAEPGTKQGSSQNNGFRSAKITYNAIPFNWYEAIGDGYVNTNNGKINQPFLHWFDKTNDAFLDPAFNFSNGQQQFYPFGLMDFRGRLQNNVLDPYLTPGYLLETTFGPFSRSPLDRLNNVDIVLTPDKSKWSRCVVVETANAFYTNKYNPNNPATENYLGLETKANPQGKFPLQFDLRGDLSVGKNDSDGDGRPDPDNAQDASGAPLYGMGWFPGYAVDIETGKRLNIFFGENSCYSEKHDFYCPKENQIGGDMLWNPNGNLYVTPDFSVNRTYKYFAGGQQWIYVTNQTYDACESVRTALASGSKSVKAAQFRNVTWVSMPMPTKPMKPLGAGNKGLIPSEMLVRMRVDNAYQWKSEKGLNNGYPTYYLSFGSRPISDQNTDFELFGLRAKRRPDLLAFPNPVQTGEGLQLQNLPEAAEVEIFDLTGKLIAKQAASFQYVWNLQGTNGKTVTPGVYVVKVLDLQTEQYEAIKVIVH